MPGCLPQPSCVRKPERERPRCCAASQRATAGCALAQSAILLASKNSIAAALAGSTPPSFIAARMAATNFFFAVSRTARQGAGTFGDVSQRRSGRHRRARHGTPRERVGVEPSPPNADAAGKLPAPKWPGIRVRFEDSQRHICSLASRSGLWLVLSFDYRDEPTQSGLLLEADDQVTCH